MLVKSIEGQTIYDIALQQYGCFEGVFLILEDNPTINLNTVLQPNTEIKIKDILPELNANNKRIVQVYNQQNVQPNSSYIVAANGNGYVNEGYVNDNYVN